ncbi:16S rRNA (cytidine(1402)-2'-O)-methyltransferase [Bacillus fonticola]|uniref:16S rRNA (cytidine(1402)-2'-O)-methyltransferase n=1 Tax=Bacillus fonticola TaxID=2728853 RepID=UPI001474C7AC|nr:16S rRNA (cytidine(1402)-2'-O)-methyltransferase [Bacillus fonticola]
MWNEQKSFFSSSETGTLFVVPTPIGNLDDMTVRAINTLQTADLIAAEDTRHTKKLCHKFEILTPLISYHEHNKEERGRDLLERLGRGETVALVSDAGTPAVSDPGYELVQACTEQGITVVSLPGPNAALTGLVASGLQVQPFLFYGFLPRQKKEKTEALESLLNREETVILYESPHRLRESLTLLASIAAERFVVVARELTKQHETYIRGTAKELAEWSGTESIRGECCVYIAGNSDPIKHDEPAWWSLQTMKEHVETYIKEGMQSKDAIKQVAVDREIQKREVYQAYHVED